MLTSGSDVTAGLFLLSDPCFVPVGPYWLRFAAQTSCKSCYVMLNVKSLTQLFLSIHLLNFQTQGNSQDNTQNLKKHRCSFMLTHV